MTTESQITGIERNVPRGVTEEISSWEIINLRHVRGGLRPVGRKPVEITGITGVALHVHVMDTIHNLISIAGQTLYFKDLATGTTKQIGNIEGELLDINHLGKFLIAATTVRKYEFTYINKTSEYSTQSYPPTYTPITQEFWSDTPTIQVYGGQEDLAGLNVSFEEYKEKMRKEGASEGWMFVRCAVELIDGTYTHPSQPLLMYLGEPNMRANVYNSLADHHHLEISRFNFNRLVFRSVDFQNWAKFFGLATPSIAGIAIFGTQPVSAYQSISSVRHADGQGNYIITGNVPLSEEYLSAIFSRSQTFWLLGRISVAELADSSFTSKAIAPDYTLLETREFLSMEDSGFNTLTHRASIVYNDRLLTGYIMTTFWSGYYDYAGGHPQALIEFEIETALGDILVRKTTSKDRIPWFIAYPDTRAKKVNIYYLDGSDYKLAFTKSLLTSEDNNLAYCWYLNTSSFQYEGERPDELYVPSDAYVETFEYLITNPETDPVVTLRDVNPAITDPNRVQASETENPLVMPYKNSYQVGNSSILGFAANGEPVSEGQFGQYPVYTFTEEGIYMMDVGVDPFISSVRQINGEVCNSPKTIRNIGIGVLFTTDKGLMIINSLQVDSLSLGFEQESHNDYAVRHNPLYKKAISLTALGQPDRFVSTIPFADYLIGSNIGYDYPNREIWVNNPQYPYSYVFSIDYKAWSKRDETFVTIVDDYPRYYAQQGNTCRNLSAKEGIQDMNIFLLSNPIKIKLDDYKQLRRIVARGEFPVTRLGMYLFGSIDGFSWAYIGGKEIASPDNTVIKAKDAIYLGAHKSVKYAALVIAGVATHEWNITHISETTDIVIDKKLR